MRFDVIVVGGGSTGVFTTLDLALRGVKVALVERNELASGTTGSFHGLLHSGARYAVNDPKSARECIEENKVLSSIAPHAIEDTGGLFVALTESDLGYQDLLEKGCRNAGIPFEEVRVEEALKLEPNLNPGVKSVIKVPDKVVYPRDLVVSAALTAIANGARLYTMREVVGVLVDSGSVLGVRVHDKVRGGTEDIRCDVLVNAAGPWAGRLAIMAGVKVDVMPTAGVMGVVPSRLTNHVINRMRPPSDGDILVPYSGVSIMGTTAVIVEDPDEIKIEDEDLEILLEEGSKMIPAISSLGFTRAYASVRPLIKFGGERMARDASRSFEVVSHEEVDGLVSVVGGKLTTARLMGEKVADLVSYKLGVRSSSKTRETRLLGSSPTQDSEVLAKEVGVDKDLAKRLVSLVGGIDEERLGSVARMLLYLLSTPN